MNHVTDISVHHICYILVFTDCRNILNKILYCLILSSYVHTYIIRYFVYVCHFYTFSVYLTTLYKVLIRSVMTNACPTWEYATRFHLLKLQHLQTTVLRAIGNLCRRTPVRELHVDFKIPYVYDYIINYAGHTQQ
jgi:hypothetical protein